MQTLASAVPKVNAFYALLYERHGILGKVDGQIFFFDDDGTIVDFEPEMAVFTTVLGRCDLADAQALLDRLHGTAPWIATHRQMEVA
jgi:hypothetical protein